MQESQTKAGDREARVPDSLRQSFTVRLAVFYGALFLIYGVHLPYLPVWLAWRGLSPEEIALITSTPFFLRVLITPTAAMYADSQSIHRLMAVWLAWAGFALALLLTQAATFWPIFLAAVSFAIAFATIMPLTETIAVQGVRAWGLDYGRMRLWGSLTFILVNFAGGWLVQHFGPEAAVWCIASSALATALASRLLPVGFGPGPPAVKAGQPKRRFSAEQARRLLRAPLFIAFLVASGAVQGAHGMFYTFGALHLQSQGISTVWVGTLWGVGVGCEVLLFAYSRAAVARFGAVPMLVMAALAAIIRWVMMSFDPPLAALFALQTLHGLTYGASHLGAMHFISKAVPESAQGTAQACYATVAAGLALGGAMLVAGHLYAHVGGGAYLAMAGLSFVGLVASLVLARRWTGGLIWSSRDEAGLAPERGTT